MTHVTYRLTAKNRDQHSVIEYWLSASLALTLKRWHRDRTERQNDGRTDTRQMHYTLHITH